MPSRTLLLHFRPVRVPARAVAFTHTFGLGGSSFVLVLLLALTGALLTLVYDPTPAHAFDSVVAIEREITFGTLVRGVHHWSANLFILVVVAHAARAFLTGGYVGRRAPNWLIGLALASLVFASAFTGYLLPWDQRAFWAVTIATSMLAYVPLLGDLLQQVARGGTDVGARTLVAFHAAHTTLVPALIVVGCAFHFWRVRKAGGVVVPGAAGDAGPADDRVKFQVLLTREIAMALIVCAVVVALATIAGAPLGARANPGMSPNPAKAPWYFMGLQELLVHLHPVVAVVVLPVAIAAALLWLPFRTYGDQPVGQWFLSPIGRGSSRLAAMAAAIVTPVLVVAHDAALRGSGVAVGGAAGLWWSGAVVFVWVGAVAAFIRAVQRRLHLTAAETVQAAVVFVAVAFAILTAAGQWFRGAHMSLTWPWTGGA